MVKNPLIRSYPKRVSKPLPNKSAGIMDDHAVRKNIATKEGTIEHVPTEDNHILNKLYFDNNTYWDRTGTVLSPKTAGDTIAINDKTFIDSSSIKVERADVDGRQFQINYAGSSLSLRTTGTDPITFAPNSTTSWQFQTDGTAKIFKAMYFRDNIKLQFGDGKDYETYYSSSTDEWRLRDVGAGSVRLGLNSSGNFDFYAGDITTTGSINVGTGTFADDIHVIDTIATITAEGDSAGSNRYGSLTAKATNGGAIARMTAYEVDATYEAYGLTLGDMTLWHNDNNSNGTVIGVHDNAPLYFGTNNTVRITIDGSGDIDCSSGDITTTGTLDVGKTTVTGDGTHGVRINQGADEKGLYVYGYDDKSAIYAQIGVDANGFAFFDSAGSGQIRRAGVKELEWSATTFDFQDNNLVTTGRVTTGELFIDNNIQFTEYDGGTPVSDTLITSNTGTDAFTFYVNDAAPRLANIKDGTNDSDAATKGQVDTLVETYYVPYINPTANVNLGAFGIYGGWGNFGTYDTNYLAIAADGELTLHGTARVIREFDIDVVNLAGGSSGVTTATMGVFVGSEFDKGDHVHGSFEVPVDWDSSTNIEFKIYWAIDEAYSSDKEVRWVIDWAACPPNETEALDSPTHTGTMDFGDQNIPATAKYLTKTNGQEIAAASLSAGDLVGFTLERDSLDDGDDPSDDPVAFRIEVEYTANKLGEAT